MNILTHNKIKNFTVFLVIFTLFFPLTVFAQSQNPPIVLGNRISPDNAALNVEIADISPISIERDEDFTVGVQIENYGKQKAENITIELKYAEPDIQVKEQKIMKIDDICASNCKKFITYHMHSSPYATIGEHELELKVSWKTSFGSVSKTYERFTITITGNPADLNIAYVKTDPIIPKVDEEMTLTIRIENFGAGEANSVKANVDLPFFGVKEAFIGTLEPDDDSPAIFTLIPDRNGSFDYNLKVSYRDDFGNHEFTEKMNLVVINNKRKFFLDLVLDNLNITITAIAVIIIISIIPKIIRSFKRKK